MTLAVLFGFAVAPALPLISRLAQNRTGWIASLLPVGLFLFFLSKLDRIQEGAALTVRSEWVPSLDVDLIFRLDGLSLFFALLISGVGSVVFLYAGAYLHGHPMIGRFYAYLTLFMASMLGLVLADHILLLFIFWELTSFSSYLLISFYSEKESAREAAKQALIVTGAGGLAMLAGLVLLGLMADTWVISDLVDHAAVIQSDSLYVPALLLILAGAFTKSAQFPFHFWLPNAMEAPAPVSAYLHSATMVKAGIFLLARLNPTLSGTDEWEVLLTGFGVITMLLAGFLGWRQTDLKRILAYTTISGLGLMVFLLGLGGEEAITAMLIFVLAHALYKGALFMVAGIVEHETGERDIRHLSGLRTTMPITAFVAALAGLSMAGIPPLMGFVVKEGIYSAVLNSETFPAALLIAATLLGNIFATTVAGLVALRPWFGASHDTHGHEPPPAMWLGPLLMAVLSLVFGLVVFSLEPLMSEVVRSVYPEAHDLHFSLWHGFNTPLVLSIITLIGGAALYLDADLLPRFDPGPRIGPERLYNLGLNGLLDFATWSSDITMRAYLRYYIRVILGVFVAAMAYVLVAEADYTDILKTPDIRIYEVPIVGIIIVAGIAVTGMRSRLAAVAAMGVVGYCVSLLYILYGAPDLAMTQFAIETLTVILFVLVIYRLPKFKPLSSMNNRVRDAIIAATVGGIITILTLIILSKPLNSRLSPTFAEQTYTEAKGHNVVNVVIVDFRGFDTMGEVTVLSIAGIGVYALLKLLPPTEKTPSNKEEKK